jgi:glyoxylase-like metal-dependent hydrolase (beta-lactamase superfamily II)
VHGRDRDLLVDTGLGHFSLPDHVALVSERPLVCVASHTHFDHIGCHHELNERCVHFADAAILADPRNEWTLANRYATDEMFDRFPEGWVTRALPDLVGARPASLADRDVVVLGDLSFQVYTPGHPPAAIGLFEQARVASSPAMSFMTAR